MDEFIDFLIHGRNNNHNKAELWSVLVVEQEADIPNFSPVIGFSYTKGWNGKLEILFFKCFFINTMG